MAPVVESSDEELTSEEEESDSDGESDESDSESDDSDSESEESEGSEGSEESEGDKASGEVKKGGTNDERTVFIGQLPKSLGATLLRSHLETHVGKVSKVIIMKFKDTNKPMGSAFVEFADIEGAHAACRLNGKRVPEFEAVERKEPAKFRKRGAPPPVRLLRVNMANQDKPAKDFKPPTERSRDNEATTVYLGNLNFKTGEKGIRGFFATSGQVTSISLPRFRDSGKRRGFAMVQFSNGEAVQRALQLNKKELDGRKVIVQLVSDNRGKRGPKVGAKRPRE